MHQSIYQPFLDECVRVTKQYILDDPMLPTTTMGPMAQPGAVGFLKAQVTQDMACVLSLFFSSQSITLCRSTTHVQRVLEFSPVVSPLRIRPVKVDSSSPPLWQTVIIP